MRVQRDEQSVRQKHTGGRIRDAFNFPRRWVSEQVDELVAEDWASWEPVVPGLRHRARTRTRAHTFPSLLSDFFFLFVFFCP